MTAPGTNNELFLLCNMSINESRDAVTNLSLTFEGYTSGATTAHRMWIYNNSGGSWEILTPDQSIGTSDGTMTRWKNSSCANYINASGILKWGVSESRSNVIMNVDYVQANTSWIKQIPCP